LLKSIIGCFQRRISSSLKLSNGPAACPLSAQAIIIIFVSLYFLKVFQVFYYYYYFYSSIQINGLLTSLLKVCMMSVSCLEAISREGGGLHYLTVVDQLCQHHFLAQYVDRSIDHNSTIIGKNMFWLLQKLLICIICIVII